MQPLEPPDCHHLSAAVGWLELGNWQEAEAELKKISAVFRFRPDVLLVQYGIEAAAGDWSAAAHTAEQVIKLSSPDPGLWIALAYAERRSQQGGIETARKTLLAAREQFPKEPIIAYNLACYECQLGDMEKARLWFRIALQIGDRELLKRMALQDSDLEPLKSEFEKL